MPFQSQDTSIRFILELVGWQKTGLPHRTFEFVAFATETQAASSNVPTAVILTFAKVLK